MPTLKEMVRAAQGPDLVVTAPHSNWMELLEHERHPNKKALTHMIKALLGGYKHERSGRFSPSAIGNPFVPCSRAVIFGYAGTPQLAADIEATEMMEAGTDAHLRWQMEGLTMGYITEAEKWTYDDDLLCGGSMDGLLVDDSILELKTANHFAYDRVVTRDREPKHETLIQSGIYMLLADKAWTSIVYENRSSGEFYEFRVARDAKVEAEVLRRLSTLKAYLEADQLPPMLDMCVQHVGSAYKMCGYRKICPLMKSVHMAQQARVDAEKAAEEYEWLGRVVPDDEAIPTWAEQIIAFLEKLPEDN